MIEKKKSNVPGLKSHQRTPPSCLTQSYFPIPLRNIICLHWKFLPMTVNHTMLIWPEMNLIETLSLLLVFTRNWWASGKLVNPHQRGTQRITWPSLTRSRIWTVPPHKLNSRFLLCNSSKIHCRLFEVKFIHKHMGLWIIPHLSPMCLPGHQFLTNVLLAFSPNRFRQ